MRGTFTLYTHHLNMFVALREDLICVQGFHVIAASFKVSLDWFNDQYNKMYATEVNQQEQPKVSSWLSFSFALMFSLFVFADHLLVCF